MNDDTPNPLGTMLACMTLAQGPRSLLCVDTTYKALEDLADILQSGLKAPLRDGVVKINLSLVTQLDRLWGGRDLVMGETGWSLSWRRGHIDQREDERYRLILIPDLSTLSIEHARTVTMLLDSPVAHLQRDGHEGQWSPRLRWLIGCPKQRLGALSPHLLDRIDLRYQGNMSVPVIPENLPRVERLPAFASEILALIPTYQKINQGVRRDIAMARLCRALAALENAPTVTADHLERAASMLYLKKSDASSNEIKNEERSDREEEVEQKSEEQAPTPTPDTARNEKKLPEQTEQTKVNAYTSSPDTFDTGILPTQPIHAYPEDDAPLLRDAFSLRFPVERRRSGRRHGGPTIGTRRARDLKDLALIPTIRATLEHRILIGETGNFRLAPHALRQYRRAPKPQHMLVLLLDHTCLNHSDPIPQLQPHLSWAYVNRANICLVQVGAASEQRFQLQAKRLVTRNLLHPAIEAALTTKGGLGTPLAHGLALAFQHIRHALQHGRTLFQEIRFVCITDGRGNVPLEASLNNQIPSNVADKGVIDALEEAKRFTYLDTRRFKPYLLTPKHEKNSRIPPTLAIQMGSRVYFMKTLFGKST